MTRALVVGCAGQDGRILSGQLRARGLLVLGAERRGLVGAIPPDVEAVNPSFDVSDAAAVDTFVSAVRPDEVYYLAATHHSSEESADDDVPELFRQSLGAHVTGLVAVLEALRRRAPASRLFYASSSHVFGRPSSATQDESTPRQPTGVYGITKSAGMDAVRFYRDRFALHASAGILYNHESSYRGDKFLSMRLVRAAKQAALARRRGEHHRIEVGSLTALVDWGYAPDYTDAMQRIVGLAEPDDYVIATGQPHSVADFAAAAFSAVDLDWREHVSERPSILARPSATLIGDAKKLRERTGWAPTVSFEAMVSRLIHESGDS